MNDENSLSEIGFELVRLTHADGTWAEFEADWRAQCEELEEDFESYAEATFEVVRDLLNDENHRAGVYAMRDGTGGFAAMCQANCTTLPGYDGPVLRVRFMTLSPTIDLTDIPMTQYADILMRLFGGIITLSYLDSSMKANHIKFHLRSPADQQFFAALGRGLHERKAFSSIKTRGAWLYVTKN